MNIYEHLNKLKELKSEMASNLLAMGVDASENDGLAVLVPKVLNIGQDSASVIGSPSIIESISYMAYVLSTGNYVTGNFLVDGPIKTMSIDTGLSRINGFIYYIKDKMENVSYECGLWGFCCRALNGETTIKGALQGKTLHFENSFIFRGSDDFEGGILTITPSWESHNAYTCFRYDNVEYVWIAW